MAKYTMQLRTICENKVDLDHHVDFDDIEDVIDASWDKIFKPWAYERIWYYDAEYGVNYPLGEHICKAILREYYTREIGAETVGLFLLWMNNRLSENIDYINDLYRGQITAMRTFHASEFQERLPFVTERKTYNLNTYGDEHGTHTGSNSSSYNNTLADSDSFHNNNTNGSSYMGSDTPQGDFDLLDGVEPTPDNVLLYATNGQFGSGSGESFENSSGNGTHNTTNSDSYSDQIFKSKSYEIENGHENKTVIDFNGKLISEYIKENAEYFIDTDEEMCQMFKDLFLNLY